MSERIKVTVNGSPVEIFRGMKVKHALIAFDQKLYAAAAEGRILVEDSHGFRIGLEGALSDGATINTRPRSGD
jgi:sulfur carrier protein ThiS